MVPFLVLSDNQNLQRRGFLGLLGLATLPCEI